MSLIKKIKNILLFFSRNFITILQIIFLIFIGIAITRLVLLTQLFNKKITVTQNTHNRNTIIYDRNGELLVAPKKDCFFVLNLTEYKKASEHHRKVVFNLLMEYKKKNRNNFLTTFEVFNERVCKINSRFFDFSLKKSKKNLGNIEKFLLENEAISKIISIANKKSRYFFYRNEIAHLMGVVDGPIASSFPSITKFLNKSPEKIDILQLTIDIKIQCAVSQCLAERVRELDAQGGWVIVVELKSRDIVAMSSYPDFDPMDETVGIFFENSNRLLTAKYEVGSIAKINSAILYLSGEAGFRIEPNTIFELPPFFYIGQHKVKDVNPISRTPSFKEIFIQSSNVGFAKIMESVNPQVLIDFYDRIGYHEAISVDEIFKEGPQKTLVIRKMYELIPKSYGYSMSMSGLRAASIFSNSFTGKKKPLKIIKNIKYNHSEGKIFKRKKDEERDIFNKENHKRTVNHLMEMFRALAKGNPTLEKLGVVSKTGTALILQKGKYLDNGIGQFTQTNNFLFALWPEKKPKYLFILCIERPQKISRAVSNLVTRPMLINIMKMLQGYLKEE